MAEPRDSFWQLEHTNRRETALLVVVFIVLFTALGCGLDFVFGNLRVIDGHITGAPVLTVIALVIGSAQSLLSYFGGASLVLASVHAQPLIADSPKEQIVIDVVNEMALAARMPVPRAYIIDDVAPNAFATGRDPRHSVICVTRGLVDEMDREELQGVIGHEMAHVRDYDIRTMMMIAVLVGGIAMLADFVLRWSLFGGFGSSRGDRDNSSGGGNAGALIAIAVFVLAAIAPIFSQLLAMAISRQREYLSDAASVEFTRNPRALLRALEHLAQTESPLKNASRGTAHLFIVNPLEGAGNAGEGFFANLLSTHPPLTKRIARLRALAGESGPGAAAVAPAGATPG